MPEIDVQSLVKQFADQRALDRVSFRVAGGELFTLLGPTGCGKSTTLMSIAGFQTPEEGRVAVGGDVFFDAGARVNVPAERRNLGIVFQSYEVWPHMTVFQNRFVAEFVGRVNLVSGRVVEAERGRLALELAEGRKLWVDVDRIAPPDTLLTVAVRPETLRLEAAESSTLNGGNTLDAHVRSAAFLGDHYQYELAAGTLSLLAQTAQPVLAERVKVHIPPDACAIVE